MPVDRAMLSGVPRNEPPSEKRKTSKLEPALPPLSEAKSGPATHRSEPDVWKCKERALPAIVPLRSMGPVVTVPVKVGDPLRTTEPVPVVPLLRSAAAGCESVGMPPEEIELIH